MPVEVTGIAISRHVIGMMITFSKNLKKRNALQMKEGNWLRFKTRKRNLS